MNKKKKKEEKLLNQSICEINMKKMKKLKFNGNIEVSNSSISSFFFILK